MSLHRFTTLFLKFIAFMQVLTGGIAFIPEAWVGEWHHWLGLHQMPHDPMLLYILRGAAYSQGAIGVLLWIIAGDIVRYRPLVVATGAIYLAAVPAFYFIESIAGMPRFWYLFDCASCFVVGATLLVLCRCTTAPVKT